MGTPTMRGEYCEFVFADGSRCVFGARHEVGYHHSETGLDHYPAGESDGRGQDLMAALLDAAKRGNARIRELSPERFPDGVQAGDAATLCVVEEAGEFAGAYRRWRGYARRPGSLEEMSEELADVVISSFFAADDYGIDLPAAIRAKLDKLFARSWKGPRPSTDEQTRAS